MKKKGQVTFEFMVVYSALLTIFLIAIYIYFDGSQNLFQAQDTAASTSNSKAIASAINFVYLAGDGAAYNFTASNILNQTKENITITNYSVNSKREHGSASAQIINSNISASAIIRGNILISNNRGGINIQQ
jgi:uncharacterized protein (UPF0333 family)